MSIPKHMQLLSLLPFINLPEPISRRSRRTLLKMMETEVNVRLDDSLYYQELMQLHGKDQVELEQTAHFNPTSPKQWLQPERSLEIFGGSKTQLDSTEKLIEVFERDDIAGKLLILGAPGSGKTTTLLELARDLIQRAQHHTEQPIPVLFELSDWNSDKPGLAKRNVSASFAKWLAADLKFRHNIPKAITRKWIKTGQLLPLLDGLDELELTQQQLCIQKINDFLKISSGQSFIVICSRQDEYIEGEAILEKLRGSIVLQSLKEEQIETYLQQLECEPLWQIIKNDTEGLLALAKIPLLLTLMPVAVAYSDEWRQVERSFSDPKECQDYQGKCCQDLFDAYIKLRLEQPHNHQRYKPKKVKHWLIWLAKTLKEGNQTEFRIEKIQPSLLKTIKQKLVYQLIIGLIIGLTGGLIGGLLSNLVDGIILGIICGIAYSIFKNKIESAEASIFYGDKSKEEVIIGLVFALTIGLIVWLVFGATFWMINELMFWLVFGFLGGIIIGLVVKLDEDKIDTINKPNQGIRKSAKNTITISLISFPAGMLLYALLRVATGQPVELFRVLNSGLGLALFLGIGFGGLACIQHFVLRLILWWTGAIPWNYARFLNYAAERRFIKQVGGCYRFIHNLLRDRFAEMQNSL